MCVCVCVCACACVCACMCSDWFSPVVTCRTDTLEL